MPVRSAGSVGSGQTYSFALAYSRDALKMAVGYFHIDNGSVTLSSRGINSAGNLFQTPVNAAYASARSINIARAGVTYVLDQVTLGAYYSFAEYVADGSSTFPHSERYNNASAFAMWQISQPFQLEIGYDQLKSDGDSSAIYRRLTFAADYKLSKRTEVYALGGWGGASGHTGAGVAQAVISDSGVDAGSGFQAIAIVGICHHF